MGTLLNDLRFAARMLAKRPAFTALAALTLAVGIGANATLFTWINAVLLRPLPGVSASERLVQVFSLGPARAIGSVSYPDYRDLRDASRAFSHVIAFTEQAMSLRGGPGDAERIWGQLVSGNYFEALGVEAVAGRLIRPTDDEVEGRDPVIVLGHGLWQRRFGGDPGVVGRSVTLDGRAFTVVGVAAPAFCGTVVGLSFEAWVPMAMQPAIVPGGDRLGPQTRDSHWLDVLARLAPGTSIEGARAELQAISARLAREYPKDHEAGDFALYPLKESPQGAVRILAPVLAALAFAGASVLLIACANVASLLLARAASRRREIAVRLALGATRRHLVRQLLTESLLLSLAGGTLGILLAYWSAGLLLAFVPPTELPVGMALAVESRALAFTLGLSILTGLVFGLVPALRSSRPDLVEAVKEEAGVSGSRSRSRIRSALVVTQLALSLVLLVSAGLLLKSAREARGYDPGFDSRGVLLASLDLFPNGYAEETSRAFAGELLGRLRALPGAEAVTLARRVPLSLGGNASGEAEVVGYTAPPKEPLLVQNNEVGPGYFKAMRIPLRAGRDFRDQDDARAPRVAIVSEAMARRCWPRGEALLGRVKFDEEWHTVVGVARDIRYRSLEEAPAPVLYRPMLQVATPAFTIHLRSGQGPTALAALLRDTVRRLDPTLPVFAVRTLEEHMGVATIGQRLASALTSIFGAIALLLAAVGIYGVLATAVAERTREFGIRMALGGERFDLMGLVLRPALGLAATGIAIGLLGAFLLTRLLGGLLFGVRPLDPAVLAGVVLLLLGIALVATLVPALRAARVDPARALSRG